MTDEQQPEGTVAEGAEPNETDVSAVTAAPVVEQNPEIEPESAPPVHVLDGTVRGEPVLSDGHCPKLVDEANIDRRTVVTRHFNAEGEPTGKTVLRRAEQVLQDPVKCPSCEKMVERHQLLTDVLTGKRDCAIAIQERANPAYTARFGGDARAAAESDAKKTEELVGGGG